MNEKKFFKIIIFVICIIVSVSFALQVISAEHERRVLFISSYDDLYEIVPEEIEGILNIFEKEEISLDTEYMDTKRFDSQENIEIFYESLKYKLDNSEKYDGIIVGDDPALKFVVDYQEELFNDIPIVFLGINDLENAMAASKNEEITGVMQKTPLEENIELALKINPEANRVVALVDGTLTGIGDKKQFYDIQEDFPSLAFEDIDASKYSFDEIEYILNSINDDTILLFLNMFQDKTNQTKDVHEMVELITGNVDVPVYRATRGGVGNGLLGGVSVSFVGSGELAANMMLDVFNGKEIKDIEMIYESPIHTLVDYDIVNKFDIDISVFSEETEFINKEPSIFETYRTYVMYLVMIFVFLLLIILFFIIDNLRKRAVQKKLKNANDELSEAILEITAIEEELRNQYETTQEYLKEIELLNQKFEIAVKVTESGVWELEVEKNLISISQNFGEIIGTEIKQKENATEFVLRTFGQKYGNALRKLYHQLEKEEIDEMNLQIPVNVKGDRKWVLIRGRGVRSSENKITIVYGIMLDITVLKMQEEKISEMAKHDFLTNLPNRFYYITKLNEAITNKQDCTVILLDLDNFKEVNDTLGHVYGDRLLKEFSKSLSKIESEDIFVSRFGGDEFIVLITGTKEVDKIEKIIKNIKYNCERIIRIDNLDNYISFSIGISRFPLDGSSSEELIMNADTAMYSVKGAGKNSYTFYDDKMKSDLIAKTEIENILRNALKDNGYQMLYQPQVSTKEGNIISFEALLRLKNHNISPVTFIKVAEETDLIIGIGRFVVNEVVSQIAKWKMEGFSGKKVSINFSTKQLRDKEFISYLKRTMDQYGVRPEEIEIEITESILLEKNEVSMTFLEKLKELGVSIALDDFGTGYSSINYLTYIPVDKIKLDKSLCDKFLYMENISVMNSIISLAHSFNLSITAEGIEEKIKFERLKEAGCDYIQGFLFSKPLKSEEVEEIYFKKYI